MEILAVIVGVVFLSCGFCVGWGALLLIRAFSLKTADRTAKKYLWFGVALFFVGGFGATYTGTSWISIVFGSSETKSTVSGDDRVLRNDSGGELVATNASGCVLDWGDLRVQGNYGSITVANRSKAIVAITVSANGVSLQANLEPNRGVRLRNGLKLPEPNETVWVVKLASGESRKFTFTQCMPLGCDIPPAAQRTIE